MRLTAEHTIRENARIALEQGKISVQEHDYYVEHKLAELRQEIHQTMHPKAKHIAVGAMLLLIGMFMVFAVLTGSPTGLVVFDDLYAEYSENILIPINATNINSFKLSGSIENGSFIAHLLVDNTSYLVYEATTTIPRITTTYSSYAKNSDVEILVNAENYTLWLNDKENSSQINNTITINNSGNYSVDALFNESGTITKETITFIVRQDGSAQQNILRQAPTVNFTRVCVETCSLQTTNEELILEIETTGVVTITEVYAGANSAPEQIAQIPTIAVNGQTTIDVAPYFTDANNDSLVYELNNIVGIEETIVGSQITLASNVSGNYVATLYVSDLTELLQTTFNITVIAQESIVNETVEENNTTNETTNQENQTTETNTTTQTTNETIQETSTVPANVNNQTANQVLNSGLGCEHPNINKRPASCFSEVMDNAFEDIVAPFRDKEQQRVGRITRFGNLIIAGVVVENSASEPSSQDFVLGYTQTQNFVDTFIPTVWVDSSTGDLHLLGELYEEEKEMQPPQYNSFISVNEKGIILSYINEITGDVYLRGNIVQLGKP